MKYIFTIIILILVIGCSGASTILMGNNIPHKKVVDCVKVLLETEMLSTPAESQISETLTQLSYQELTMESPPALYTPNLVYDRTIIEVDTSFKDKVIIRVESYRPGNIFKKRLHETEARVINDIKMHEAELTSVFSGAQGPCAH